MPTEAATFSMVLLSLAALATGGYDRLPQRWPFAQEPSSVTIKLPPPRTAAPGFEAEAAAGPATQQQR